jgi:hypothetical protein
MCRNNNNNYYYYYFEWGVSVVFRLIEIQGGEKNRLSWHYICFIFFTLSSIIFFVILYRVVTECQLLVVANAFNLCKIVYMKHCNLQFG